MKALLSHPTVGLGLSRRLQGTLRARLGPPLMLYVKAHSEDVASESVAWFSWDRACAASSVTSHSFKRGTRFGTVVRFGQFT